MTTSRDARTSRDLGGLVAAVALAVLACGPPPQEPGMPPAVRGLQEAFERHDVPAVLEHVTADVEWLSVDGSGVTASVQGRDELGRALRELFASRPTVRSAVEESLTAGEFVSIRVRLIWRAADGAERTQVSLAVYETSNGLVRRVWAFPAP
jgi:hypothetical protein